MSFKKIKISLIRDRAISTVFIAFICTYLFPSCKKYLDAKPNISLEVPNSLADLQALIDLDNNWVGPCLPDIACDDYYVSYALWNAQSTTNHLNYVWDANANYPGDWDNIYTVVYTMNNVLDNLSNVSAGDSIQALNAIRGSALFYRAYVFYELAQMFSPPLTNTNSNQALGICLRLTSSVTAPSIRSTVQQTYDQIINDLKTAIPLLPLATQYPTRPIQAAALAELARTYLSIQDYPDAGLYADSALRLDSALMNYNSLKPATTYPIPLFNQETLFYMEEEGNALLKEKKGSNVDSALYESYAANDLRKSIFFKSNGVGTEGFYGSYAGGDFGFRFIGIATDELYLIRAECSARNGNMTSAMQDLNTLLQTRWVTGTFVPYTAANATDALNQILTERRKELVCRGTRWTDLRRLNQDPNHAITLTRNLNGQIYTLPPNDLRYTFLLPLAVVTAADLQQNPR